MSDPLNDPRFPNRPTHPDFWRLSEVLTYLDGEAVESGRPLMEIAGELVDLKALTYVARMRAKKARESVLQTDPETQLAATFLNAALVGILFQQRGGHREE